MPAQDFPQDVHGAVSVCMCVHASRWRGVCVRERKIHGLNAKEFRCILKYVLQSGGSAETFKDMEWSGVEKT